MKNKSFELLLETKINIINENILFNADSFFICGNDFM